MQQIVGVHNAFHTISPSNQSEIWTAGHDYYIKELKLLLRPLQVCAELKCNVSASEANKFWNND